MNKHELLIEAWSSIRANSIVQDVRLTPGLDLYDSNAKGRIEILLDGFKSEILTTGSQILHSLVPNYVNFGLEGEEALDIDIIPADLAAVMCRGITMMGSGERSYDPRWVIGTEEDRRNYFNVLQDYASFQQRSLGVIVLCWQITEWLLATMQYLEDNNLSTVAAGSASSYDEKVSECLRYWGFEFPGSVAEARSIHMVKRLRSIRNSYVQEVMGQDVMRYKCKLLLSDTCDCSMKTFLRLAYRFIEVCCNVSHDVAVEFIDAWVGDYLQTISRYYFQVTLRGGKGRLK